MNFLDIVLGLLLLWGLWKGLSNGLLIEIASIIALIAGIYGAIHFSYIAGDYLSERMEWDEKFINIAALIITFVLIVLAVHILGKILTKIIDFAMLGILNKLAGAIFGIFKVAVILGALLVFMERLNTNFNFPSEKLKTESVLYTPLVDIGAFIFDDVLKGDLTE
ncbi:CvpA family protein [Maribacter sp. PR1]|uniref:CvpA family protein n=1 Tax=Maribacter cobaltidurans TaxID=1178778 RepID=A0ABU7IRJ6_9FLAO|nr:MULTISPECIES: CvpA family protein [Maribacter]MDC6388043.1 CvpA family protein [Maribacter sp. PR1]MEE1975431.1 CvpA family protein [Maribacter cobaltidurans]